MLDKKTYLKQAVDFAEKKEFEKAIEAYKKAYELDPDDSYASDQISIIYEREFHDNAKAEYWKNKSYDVTSGKISSDFGASAKAYEERAERKKQRQAGGR